jgi:hypothetical protein
MAMAPVAGASTLSLSNISSDPGVDPADLSATLGFEVDGSTLTLAVSNDSGSFDITGFYFNAIASVTALSLTSGPRDWKLEDPSNRGHPTDTGAFGVFDYIVWVKGKKAGNAKLQSGDVATFVFEIGGSGPFVATDFTNAISVIDGAEIDAYSAALFGEKKDSPIGATHAPEPTTGLLFGMGICFLSAYSGRRRSRPVR